MKRLGRALRVAVTRIEFPDPFPHSAARQYHQSSAVHLSHVLAVRSCTFTEAAALTSRPLERLRLDNPYLNPCSITPDCPTARNRITVTFDQVDRHLLVVDSNATIVKVVPSCP